MRAWLRPAFLALVLAAGGLATISGCVSAGRQYRDGMEAEVAGDYDGAVRRYAAALRRDASLPNVRGRLVVASREAVRQHLAAAAVAPGPIARADAWLAADAVVAEAATAGVDAERPPTYAADRDAALDAAAGAILDGASADVAAADYERAVAALGGADRYRPSAARRAEMAALRRDALVAWGEADLATGRYRDALARADAAGDTPGGDGAASALVHALRTRILDAGTQRVVLLPADADRGAPRGWSDRLDDALADRLDGRPFLAVADAADVRRALGRGAPDAPLARAAWVAERMDADLAVVVRLDDVDTDERLSERRRVTARLRGRGDTTSYVRERVDVRLTAGAELTVLRAGQREPACSERATGTGSGRWTRATFRGSPATLDLSRDERALFDGDAEDDARRDALDDAADALADRLGRLAEDCLMRYVP